MGLLEKEPLKLNFPTKIYEKLSADCGFTDFEKRVFSLKQRGFLNVEIVNEFNYSLSKINRTIKDIKHKILKYYKNEIK